MFSYSVYCWNVGRGEATLLVFEDVGKVHVVDFGTNPPLKNHVENAVREASGIVNRSGRVDVFITHLHYDHYSLIPHVMGSKSIDNLYLPIIPKPKDIREAIAYLLALQAIILMKSGQALDEIANKARKVYVKARGMEIPVSSSVSVRVLWPPSQLPYHIAEKVRKKLQPLYEKSRKLAEKLRVESEVSERARQLVEELGRVRIACEEEVRELIAAEEVEVYPRLLPTFREPVENFRELRLEPEVEEFLEAFKDVVNDLSLVLKYYYCEYCEYYHCRFYHDSCAIALIPGDNSREVLNHLSRLEDYELTKRPWLKHVVFMRGAHHGTYFGEYLKRHRALIAWLSWTENLKRHPYGGYYSVAPVVAVAQNVHKLFIHTSTLCMCRLRPHVHLTMHPDILGELVAKVHLH